MHQQQQSKTATWSHANRAPHHLPSVFDDMDPFTPTSSLNGVPPPSACSTFFEEDSTAAGDDQRLTADAAGDDGTCATASSSSSFLEPAATTTATVDSRDLGFMLSESGDALLAASTTSPAALTPTAHPPTPQDGDKDKAEEMSGQEAAAAAAADATAAAPWHHFSDDDEVRETRIVLSILSPQNQSRLIGCFVVLSPAILPIYMYWIFKKNVASTSLSAVMRQLIYILSFR